MDQNAPQKFSFPVINDDFKTAGSHGSGPYCHPGGTIHSCVEVAVKPEGVALRDSKDPNGPILFFTSLEWDAFKQGVVAGTFDTTK